jgi:hypothetical protein
MTNVSPNKWKEWTDIGDSTSYYGYSPIGVDETDESTLIKRIIRDETSATEAWAGELPNKRWDQRTTLVYT